MRQIRTVNYANSLMSMLSHNPTLPLPPYSTFSFCQSSFWKSPTLSQLNQKEKGYNSAKICWEISMFSMIQCFCGTSSTKKFRRASIENVDPGRAELGNSITIFLFLYRQQNCKKKWQLKAWEKNQKSIRSKYKNSKIHSGLCSFFKGANCSA